MGFGIGLLHGLIIGVMLPAFFFFIFTVQPDSQFTFIKYVPLEDDLAQCQEELERLTPICPEVNCNGDSRTWLVTLNMILFGGIGYVMGRDWKKKQPKKNNKKKKVN